MKYLISIAIAIAAFFAFGISLQGMGMKGDLILIPACIAGVIVFIVCLTTINVEMTGTSIASGAIGAVKDMKENIESNLDAKQAYLYAKAEEEYDSGKINKGLWSQALVKAKGDEKLRKIEYMKLRVKHLKRSR